MTRFDAVLKLLKTGKPVFPTCWTNEGVCVVHKPKCEHPGKTPLVKWKAYQDNLPSEQELTEWWTKWTDANIGMATGHLCGWVIIDCDSEEAANRFIEEYPEAKDTLQVQTGRGKHYYFEFEEGIRNDAGKLLGPGIDIRGEGGFVIVPPSVHANGKNYIWLHRNKPISLPGKLREILIRRSTDGDQPNGVAYRERFDTAQALAGVPEGQRDEIIFKLACKLRNADVPKDMAEALILEAARNCQPPFPDSVALEKVDRAYRQYQSANQEKTHNFTSDYREGPSEVKFEEVNAEDLRQEIKANGRTPLTYLPLLGQENFLVKGWSHILAAYPKSGKTELLVRVLSEWLGESILYFTEEPRGVWEARLDLLPESYTLKHVTIRFALGMTPQEILGRIKKGPETVVVIDTVRNLLGLHDEKDNSEVARAMIPYIAATRQKGQTPIFVHHDKKSGGEDGRGITGGHAFLAVVNIAIELLREKGNRRRLRGWGHVIEVPELLYEKQADGTFKALGSPEAITLEEVKERAALALDDNWQKTAKVEETIGDPKPSRDNLIKALEALARNGQAERIPPISEGKRQGVAYQWRRAPNFTSDSLSYRSEVKPEDKEKGPCPTFDL